LIDNHRIKAADGEGVGRLFDSKDGLLPWLSCMMSVLRMHAWLDLHHTHACLLLLGSHMPFARGCLVSEGNEILACHPVLLYMQ
jgi:hypothetical protein